MSGNATLQEIRRAQPYRPDGPRAEHEDHTQRLLQRLREVGAAGITTGELIREGCCGLRPPNRAKNLRDAGHLIETRAEGKGVFRYVLIRENLNPQPRRRHSKKAEQATLSSAGDWYEQQAGRPRPSGQSLAQDGRFVLTPPEPRQ